MTLLTKRINTSISTLLLIFSTIFPQVSSYNPFKKFCPYIPFHIRSFHVSNSTSFYFNLSLPKPHLKHPSEQQKPLQTLLPQAPMSDDDYSSDSPSHTRAPHRETPHSAYYTSTKRRILGTSPSLPSLPSPPNPPTNPSPSSNRPRLGSPLVPPLPPPPHPKIQSRALWQIPL